MKYPHRMQYVLDAALVIVLSVNLPFAIYGYLLFGSATKGQSISNIHVVLCVRSSWERDEIRSGEIGGKSVRKVSEIASLERDRWERRNSGAKRVPF